MRLGCTLRRCRARDHGAVLNRSRRRGYMRSDVYRAERAVLRRLDPDRVGHLRAPEGARREPRGSAVDGLAIHEGIAICHRYEIDVANVRVEDVSIADKRVPFIDSFNELVTAAEPGEKRFAKAQREPAYPSAVAKTATKTKAASEETDESRSIDRRTIDWARAPAPATREMVPAAIVERSKAPGRIVNPGPAPRADPVPIARAVGSPVGFYFTGIPNVAVLRFIAPVAVIIQIAVARRIARNVLSGNRVIFLQVALGGPAVEAVRTGSLRNDVVDVVRAVEFRAFACVDFIGLTAGGNFAFAANRSHASGVAALSYVNAKCSSLLHGECQVRGVNFVEVAFAQFTDAEIDAAFRKAHLCDALIKVQERQGGHAAEMDGRRAGLQFGAGIFVDPNFVTDGHRTVSGGTAPIALPPRLQGDGTFNVADARDARGRIRFLFLARLRLRSHNTQKTGQTQQQT